LSGSRQTIGRTRAVIDTGAVRFDFDWASLIAGKKFYWVESIAYGIEAARLLVTDTDWSHLLTPYSPSAGNGPWWQPAANEHYWNGKFTLEIMYDGDSAYCIGEEGLVRSTPRQEMLHRSGCLSERDEDPTIAGARFIAMCVSREHPATTIPMTQEEDGSRVATTDLQTVTSRLIRRCDHLAGSDTGSITSGSEDASAVAHALVGAFARKMRTQCATTLGFSRPLTTAPGRSPQSWDIHSASTTLMPFTKTASSSSTATAAH